MNGVMNNSSLQDAQLRLQGFQNFVNERNVADGTDVKLVDGDAGGITQEQSASWHDRTWHSGREDVRASIDRNNAVRQNFLDALIEVYGEGNKDNGFWCLPEYIRKALKGTWACGQAGDFKLVADDSAAHGFRVTSGRPLSARRIRAVFRAIAREEIRRGQTNSAQGVANVGDKEESEKFKTKFTDFFNGYNFGTPLVGEEARVQEKRWSGKSSSPETVFYFFNSDALDLPLREMLKKVEGGITGPSRKGGKLYNELKTAFCENLQYGHMLNDHYANNDSEYEKAIAKVFYDFIVAFNKENHDFAITIPQEEIEAQSQQQNELPQQDEQPQQV